MQPKVPGRSTVQNPDRRLPRPEVSAEGCSSLLSRVHPTKRTVEEGLNKVTSAPGPSTLRKTGHVLELSEERAM